MTNSALHGRSFINLLDLCHYYMHTGAYEGKEHATTIYTWVPSKYEFKPAQLPYKESAWSISGVCDAIKCMCIHINYWLVQYTVWRADPLMMGVTTSKKSELHEMWFVFWWHSSYTLLLLICSWCTPRLHKTDRLISTIFPWILPAGTTNFRVCQNVGTNQGWEQNKGGFN